MILPVPITTWENLNPAMLLPSAQNALRKVVNGVGGFDHVQWRAFSNERTTNDAHGFIDGDLIEQVRSCI